MYIYIYICLYIKTPSKKYYTFIVQSYKQEKKEQFMYKQNEFKLLRQQLDF